MSNITPDFIVESENGQVVMYLNNQNIPSLNVSRDFAEMLQGYNQNKDSMSANDKQTVAFYKAEG